MSNIKEICENCKHCAAEGWGAYCCEVDLSGSMCVNKKNKCKFTPSRFKYIKKDCK